MTGSWLRWQGAAVAISLVLAVPAATLAQAQDPGASSETPAPPAPPAETAAPSAAAPATPPTDATTAPDQAPAASETTGEAPADGQTLPEVQIIQEAPKPPPPPKQVEAATPKPKKKPAAVVAAPPPAAPVAEPPPLPTGVAAYAAPSLDDSVKISPLAGGEVPLSKVPGAVGRANAADFARQPTPTPQSVVESQVPGVILTDLQGNEFQTQLDYRGFYSSPLPGVAQGLAVYQNGVRINEAFGDFVNFDALPSNAISNITIESGNPVFGLNAIGGAAIITMRDGFNFQGTEIDTRFGSNGRIQGGLATGMQSGNWATFLALEGIEDDGWRDFSPSRIKRIYADLGFKDSTREFHLNFTGADNFVGAVTAAPVELLALGWERTFTSPQTSDNQVAMLSLNGSVKATDTLTISGAAYYRRFKQRHLDGNLAEFEECNVDQICPEGSATPLTSGGVPIEIDNPADAAFGSLDRTGQDADSFGVTLQAVSKERLFDRPNQLVLGMSYDGGRVDYNAASEPGLIGTKLVVTGGGLVIDGPEIIGGETNDYLPRNLSSKNDYLGFYLLDSLDVTDELTLTFGGRYNYAWIDLVDNTGNFDGITSKHDFDRFNPNIGATYKLFPGLTVYGGYSEANRAPTPAELACADPDNPCLIETFLTDDPPLKQVVSKTWELGLRGEALSPSGLQKVSWTVGYFHTLSKDDILSLPAEEAGRGYFANGGDTLRQGIEVGLNYSSPKLRGYVGYSYIAATFEDSYLHPSPNTPATGPDVVDCETESTTITTSKCVRVRPGDTIPGVPTHRFKAGFNYSITDRWKFGADLVAASSQYFFGDEANLTRKLPSWWRVNLNSSYDITDNIQIYGVINNVFDKRYGVFGNFFDTDESSEAGESAGLGPDFFTDPRTILPAAPVAAYGGVKVKF